MRKGSSSLLAGYRADAGLGKCVDERRRWERDFTF
jgi:hypothetical protein